MLRDATFSLIGLTALCVSCSASGTGASGGSGNSGGGPGTSANGPNAGTGASISLGTGASTSVGGNASGSPSPTSSGPTGAGTGVIGTDGGSAATGAGDPCYSAGTTRSCCSGKGTEKCDFPSEFGVWGPCIAANGIELVACPVTRKERLPDAGTPPPPPPLCNDMAVNTEPEILGGYSPYPGQTVGATGQIKVWVDDENSPFIAPGEQVDTTTGVVTAPGDRTAKAPDGFLWEPALYISPQTAASGGKPYFPSLIKGSYNNNPPTRGTGAPGAALDPIPPGTPPPPASSRNRRGGGNLAYHAEFVWDVSALGLAPGTYAAEFLIYDGDKDRGIGCVNIVITQ